MINFKTLYYWIEEVWLKNCNSQLCKNLANLEMKNICCSPLEKSFDGQQQLMLQILNECVNFTDVIVLKMAYISSSDGA